MKIKKIIFSSVIFLVVFVPTIAFGQWSTGYQNAAGSELPSGTISNIVLAIMNWILALIGVIGIIGFVISGILYLTAAGDDAKAGTAKKAMTYSIIGVVVGIVGFVIIQAADSMLRGESLF